MRRPRADISYYEWGVTRWRTSTTRAQLSPEGRSIYRELLDQCYVTGGIPSDLEILSRMADCTLEQMQRVWPIIQHHFRSDKHNPGLLLYPDASVWRKNTLAYLRRQKHNASGKKTRTLQQKNPHTSTLNPVHNDFQTRTHENSVPVKSNGIMDMSSGGCSLTKRSERSEYDEYQANEAKGPLAPPKDTPPPKESLDEIRLQLVYYVNDLCHLGWPPPDDQICSTVYSSIQGDMEFFKERLNDLWKKRKAKPGKSYAWFTSVLRKEN